MTCKNEPPSPLSCQRDHFALPERIHYLNCAYMAPLAHAVEAAGIEGVGRKSAPWLLTSDFFFAESDRVRTLFADLVDALPSQISLQPAASYGLANVRHNLRLAPSQNVVVAAEQFPSNYYPWSRLARDTGAELRVIAAPPGAAGRAAAWNTRLYEAIDGDTGLVALPHVHWADGTIFHLAEIGQRARAVGAALIIDGTQSIGALPFSVRELRPDALICAAYKTLFGPYGSAVSYYSDRFADAQPIEDNWIARRGSEDFAALVHYQESYRADASRFDAGERSNFANVAMLRAALELVLGWQPRRVADYCGALVSPFVERFRELGWQVEREGERADHLFGLRTPGNVDLRALAEQLAARSVYVSIRGAAVRVSPNVYNRAADLEALCDALAAATGAATT